MVDATSVVTDIRKPDSICMDCGRTFLLSNAEMIDDQSCCPRCSSMNHIEYIEAEHQDIEIKVPEGYEHEAEAKARELFNRVSDLTGWREAKVRLWFQLQNPLLGMVSPEFMLMNDRGDRLEKFIEEAENMI